MELLEGSDAFRLQEAALEKGKGICSGHIFPASECFHL
jgi:hypothetical protein